jgi:predicted RNA binding protein YcfA (HicA-like mRNA interferase family)
MAKLRDILARVKQGSRSIPFRDLERLLHGLGFRLLRTSGSHHIYLHPKASRPINIQPIGKDAKPYQVRQLRAMLAEFEIELEE